MEHYRGEHFLVRLGEVYIPKAAHHPDILRVDVAAEKSSTGVCACIAEA
jgi:hypothetical protein